MTVNKGDLLEGGFAPLQAEQLATNFYPVFTTESGIAAAGSVLSQATATTADFVHVGTCVTGTGVKLRTAAADQKFQVIINRGAGQLKVYPPDASAQINYRGPGTAVFLNASMGGLYYQMSSTEYLGLQSIII